jgi:UDP-N-acetylmuramate: L-alanyl-gamma-D-glutamyl-meso-diaminopimelate ligase
MKHVHFIGIAGSAIAPIAVMMTKQGWKVTGSDENVFEPALSLLSDNGVGWYEGYEETRVDDADLVIIGGGPLLKNKENPEFLRAQELGKQLEGYAYLLNKYVVKEKSIVVTGSYGKSTTSSMIDWILEVAGENPSFMVGGKPADFDTGVRATDSEYSCLEGDEFVATFNFDMEPRFVHYTPKYTILSAAKWDHINVYPSEQSYIDAYHKLAKLVYENEGKLYICASGENNEKVISQYKGEYLSYMLEGRENLLETDINYLAKEIKHQLDLSSFIVELNGEELGIFETQMLGDHNIENCLASVAVLHDLGIPISKIQEGIKTYSGIKRRQEVIGRMPNGALVLDDFAHSPMKAQATLEAIRTRYKDNKVIAIYYPRPSEREDRTTLEWYPGVFDSADEVVIPRIFVKKSTPKEFRLYGKDFVEYIGKTQPNVHYKPRDEDIIKFIKENSDPTTIVVFMSASDWRGIIEDLINS